MGKCNAGALSRPALRGPRRRCFETTRAWIGWASCRVIRAHTASRAAENGARFVYAGSGSSWTRFTTNRGSSLDVLVGSIPFRIAPASLLDCGMKSDPPVIGICATASDLTVVHRVRVFVVLGVCTKGNVSTSAELRNVMIKLSKLASDHRANAISYEKSGTEIRFQFLRIQDKILNASRPKSNVASPVAQGLP